MIGARWQWDMLGPMKAPEFFGHQYQRVNPVNVWFVAVSGRR